MGNPVRLAVFMVVLLVAALFAVGQAITFAWLSSFPERASNLESLEFRFWGYAAIAVALVLIDLGLLVRLVRQIKGRRRDLTSSQDSKGAQ